MVLAGTGPVWDIAFSSDGRHFASAGGDGTARVWDSRTGEPALVLAGHTSQVWGVTFSSDGRHLATAGGDGTARIWHLSTGECLLTLAFACSGPLTWRDNLLAITAGAHWAIIRLPVLGS